MPTVEDSIWVEKHRPQTLGEIIGHENIVTRMEEWLDDESMPNLLFAGPQGTGKTAIVTAFARQKYGEEAWRNNVMQLNASDERGIDVVRDKIKTFARQSTAMGSGGSFKIVFLDEVDQMTQSAQPALRRIMEDYFDKTRFILSCNYQNQIIDPIQSRCATFSFNTLDDSEIKQLCEKVAKEEELAIAEDAMWYIVEAVDGDARKAVNTLQAASVNGQVSKESAKAVVSVFDYELADELVDLAVEGEFETAMEKLDNEVLKEGVDPETVTDTFLKVIKNRDYPAPAKIKMIDKVGETDWRILRGANPRVHLHKMLADIHISRHLNLDSYKYEQWQDDG